MVGLGKERSSPLETKVEDRMKRRPSMNGCLKEKMTTKSGTSTFWELGSNQNSYPCQNQTGTDDVTHSRNENEHVTCNNRT